MNSEARVHLRWPAVIAAAVLLVALGAFGSYVAMRPGAAPSGAGKAPDVTPATNSRPAAPSTSTDASRRADDLLPDVVLTLTSEAVERAGIAVITVESGPTTDALRLPAVVEPNAYKQVSVTPLVTGRVARVIAELGTPVRQGQTMAIVFSPELADAQARYLAARAELEAHERELARTEKLVRLGSASQQELDRLHAEHTAQRRGVEGAQSRLELLGLSREVVDALAAGKPIDANIEVPAPISGVVTERLANVGLNVDPAAKLFTVVDLSTVWIVASLYEKDFSRVRVGDRTTIATSAYPDLRLQGRISYIDPRLSPETHTAKVRVEVPNPRHDLRLGMLAEAQIDGSDHTTTTLVPRSAVQSIADRSFVYMPKSDAPGQFTEREVRLGLQSGERVQVVSGLVVGDQVVARGSFFLRAERERLGLRASGSGEAIIRRGG